MFTWSIKLGMTLWKAEFLYVKPASPVAISLKLRAVSGVTYIRQDEDVSDARKPSIVRTGYLKSVFNLKNWI